MKKNQMFISLLIILSVSMILSSCKKSKDTEPIFDFRDYVFEEPAVTGNTFYIDPVNGSMDGDGTSERPWSTLQEVIEAGLIETYRHSENYNPNSELVVVNEGAPVKGGDRLILKSGYHGFISINNFIFTDWLTIEGEAGSTPVFSQFKVTGAFENFYLKNFIIRKESYVGTENYWESEDVTYNTNACLYLGSSDFWGEGKSVKVNGLTLKTADDISSWTAADWVQKSSSGLGIRDVTDVEVINCQIENISFGIAVSGSSDNTKIVNNTVKNFSGDGARLISNNTLFAYNKISDCFKVDDNHDDLIQSWSLGEDNTVGTGTVKNVIVRGNLLIGLTDLDNPLAGNPQGIGCFDGFFENWIVENNVIITNHYHGISFYGMRNSKILNNTVIDQIPGDDISPWIMITDHKNDSKSENCLVANNIVFRSVSVEGNNVVEKNNYVIGRDNFDQISELFVDPENCDLHLLINSLTTENIIDKGEIIEGMISSEIDRDNDDRLPPPDLGAYEAK